MYTRVFSQHPPPFLFDGKSRTTRYIAWEFAQLSTLVKMGTYDQLILVGIPDLAGDLIRGITMGIGMGGRYHQKYKKFNRFKQNRIVLLIVYRIALSISK